jgi:hypothetical protein
LETARKKAQLLEAKQREREQLIKAHQSYVQDQWIVFQNAKHDAPPSLLPLQASQELAAFREFSEERKYSYDRTGGNRCLRIGNQIANPRGGTSSPRVAPIGTSGARSRPFGKTAQTAMDSTERRVRPLNKYFSL